MGGAPSFQKEANTQVPGTSLLHTIPFPLRTSWQKLIGSWFRKKDEILTFTNWFNLLIALNCWWKKKMWPNRHFSPSCPICSNCQWKQAESCGWACSLVAKCNCLSSSWVLHSLLNFSVCVCVWNVFLSVWRLSCSVRAASEGTMQRVASDPAEPHHQVIHYFRGRTSKEEIWTLCRLLALIKDVSLWFYRHAIIHPELKLQRVFAVDVAVSALTFLQSTQPPWSFTDVVISRTSWAAILLILYCSLLRCDWPVTFCHCCSLLVQHFVL